MVSGHGTPITDVAAALASNRRRFTQWAKDPTAAVMYAAKRILIYRLMLQPIPSDDVLSTLRNTRWLRDLAASVDLDRDQFADELLHALEPALKTEDGLLQTTATHRRSATPIPWHYTATHNWD